MQFVNTYTVHSRNPAKNRRIGLEMKSRSITKVVLRLQYSRNDSHRVSGCAVCNIALINNKADRVSHIAAAKDIIKDKGVQMSAIRKKPK